MSKSVATTQRGSGPEVSTRCMARGWLGSRRATSDRKWSMSIGAGPGSRTISFSVWPVITSDSMERICASSGERRSGSVISNADPVVSQKMSLSRHRAIDLRAVEVDVDAPLMLVVLDAVAGVANAASHHLLEQDRLVAPPRQHRRRWLKIVVEDSRELLAGVVARVVIRRQCRKAGLGDLQLDEPGPIRLQDAGPHVGVRCAFVPVLDPVVLRGFHCRFVPRGGQRALVFGAYL